MLFVFVLLASVGCAMMASSKMPFSLLAVFFARSFSSALILRNHRRTNDKTNDQPETLFVSRSDFGFDSCTRIENLTFDGFGLL